jgi:hypothetical protein
MGTRHSSRKSRFGRADGNHSRTSVSRPHKSAVGSAKLVEPAPPQGRATRPELSEVLGRFSDALAFVETGSRALNAAQDDDPTLSVHIGPYLLTLENGIGALRRAHAELDLAIPRWS